MPKVSVIVPVYNTGNYLKMCLDSIMNQSLEDLEIICIDDGSEDDSYKILKKFENKDKRIKVIHQINKGAGAARNVGLKLARGQYLAFLDSDELYDKEMLMSLYNYAKENILEIAVCRTDLIDISNNKVRDYSVSIEKDLLPTKNVFSASEIKKNFFKSFSWVTWDKLFNRAFIEELDLKFSTYRSTNDLFFVCLAFLQANRIGYIDKILVHHRIGLQKSLSFYRSDKWTGFYKALMDVKDYLLKNGYYEKYKQDFINYALFFSLFHLNTLRGISHCQLYVALRTNWLKNLGLLSLPKDFFYNPCEYQQLNEILKDDLKDHLIFQLQSTQKELDKRTHQLNEAEMALKNLLFIKNAYALKFVYKINKVISYYKDFGFYKTLLKFSEHIRRFL